MNTRALICSQRKPRELAPPDYEALQYLEHNAQRKSLTYLRIEHYSGHTEVIKAAEVLLEQYKKDAKQERLNGLPSWTVLLVS